LAASFAKEENDRSPDIFVVPMPCSFATLPPVLFHYPLCVWFLQLRVVTQEDVRFSRFRRDDVGVFELKEMIEGNTGSIEDLKTSVQTVTDAMYAPCPLLYLLSLLRERSYLSE
jgi:hypothetical protein